MLKSTKFLSTDITSPLSTSAHQSLKISPGDIAYGKDKLDPCEHFFYGDVVLTIGEEITKNKNHFHRATGCAVLPWRPWIILEQRPDTIPIVTNGHTFVRMDQNVKVEHGTPLTIKADGSGDARVAEKCEYHDTRRIIGKVVEDLGVIEGKRIAKISVAQSNHHAVFAHVYEKIQSLEVLCFILFVLLAATLVSVMAPNSMSRPTPALDISSKLGPDSPVAGYDLIPVIGNPGTGKSQSINFLFGKNVAPVGNRTDIVTRQTRLYCHHEYRYLLTPPPPIPLPILILRIVSV